MNLFPLLCLYGYQAVLTCSGAACKLHAFVCMVPECKCRTHFDSCEVFVTTQSVCNRLRSKMRESHDSDQYIKRVDQQYNTFVKSLVTQKQVFVARTEELKLTAVERQFLTIIEQGNQSLLSGEFMQALIESLNNPNSQAFRAPTLEDQWRGKIDLLFGEAKTELNHMGCPREIQEREAKMARHNQEDQIKKAIQKHCKVIQVNSTDTVQNLRVNSLTQITALRFKTLDSQTFERIVGALPSLQTVSLTNCGVDDKKLIDVLDALRDHKALQKLCLNSNKVTTMGAFFLANGMKRFQSLQIDLTQNSIDPETSSKLREMLPGCLL